MEIYTLEKATLSDMEALYPIYMHESVNSYLSFPVLSKEDFLPIFKRLLDSGDLYRLTDGQETFATCILIFHQLRIKHIVQIRTLAVHPKYQGRGIGTTLFDKIFILLKQHPEIIRVELTVEVDNPHAIAFYKKLGFEIEGTMKRYFKREYSDEYVDEHIMAKLLV